MAALRRWLRWSLAAVLVGLLAVSIGAAWWIGWTSAFPRWAFERAVEASGGALEVGELRGSLIGGATIERLVFDSEGTRVEARGLRLRWRPEWLLGGTLRLRTLSAERIDVQLGPAGDEPRPPPALPERLVLPLSVGIDEIAVGELHVRGDGFEAPPVRELVATLRHDGRAWQLPRLALRVDGWAAVKGNARLAAEAPFALTARLRAEPALEDYPQLPPLLLAADGPLEELALVLRMPAPAGRAWIGAPESAPRASDRAPGGPDGAPRTPGRGPRAGADWLRIETTLAPFAPVQLKSLHAALDGFEAAAIGLPGPRTRLTGTLALVVDEAAPGPAAAGGSLVDLPWTGRLELRNGLAGAVDAGLVPLASLSTGIDWRDARLRLDAIELALEGGGRVAGELGVDTTARQALFGVSLPPIDAQLDLAGIDLAQLTGTGWATELGGTVSLQGDRIEFALDDASRGAVSANGKARVDGELLQVETLALRTPAGSIEAAGQVRSEAPWQGDLTGRFRELMPARLSALAGIELPAAIEPLQALSGQWSVSGEFAPTLALETRVQLGEGRYLEMPLRIDWRGRVARDRLDMIALSGSLGESTLRASGAAGRAGDRLRLELRVPALQAIEPTLAGALDLSGELALPGLDANGLAAAQVDLEIEGRRLALGDQAIERATVSLDGTLDEHRLVASTFGEPVGARLEARGALALPKGDGGNAGWQWRGTVERFASREPLAVSMTAPLPLTIDAGGVEVGASTFVADGGRLELARFVYRGGRFELAGQAQRLPVSRWAERFELLPETAASIDEVLLGGEWQLAGSSLDDLDGTATLNLATGTKVNGNGGAELRFDHGRMSGRVDLVVPSLAFANRVVGPEWGLDGRLRIVADVAGTLREPVLTGTLAGRRLVFRQHRIGWRLDEGVLDARFDRERLHVDRLRLQSGDGSVTLSGALRLADMDGRFRLLAERLSVPIGPGQRFVVSGDTEVVSSASELKWIGKIGFDEGLIELRGGEAPSLPDDVVIVDAAAPAAGAPGAQRRGEAGSGDAARDGAAPAPPGATAAHEGGAPLVLTADLEADLGRQLRVRGQGIDARLTGTLKLHGAVPAGLRANGTVRVRDGVYQAYGQKLEITRGRVIFNGPIDNPVLDITAMRRGGLVEAGVSVTGTVLSPRIRLVSNPDVPDAQKLSWLVLGVGTDDARSGAQVAALTAAAATLFGGDGGGPGGGLARSLGLDVLTIRNASNSPFGADFGANFPQQAGSATTSTLGTAQDVVAIGKRLGSNVVVTYEQGLRGIWSLLRLQYDITRRLSLRAQTGTDTAIDLLWLYSFD